jgi:hypothetical protein
MNASEIGREERRLNALLEQAAPGDAPPGFAERVVAAARARRSTRSRLRVLFVASAVAAAAALALGAWAVLGRGGKVQPGPQIAVSWEKEEPPAAASPSFAVQLPVTGQVSYRVMMARIDGRCVLVARPNDVLADELEELLREPTAMVGSVSSGAPGPSMAARIR